ncbi:MAG: glutamine amidotransferase [Alphaproteobacteria bacterium]|nr:glutamine amidotransferase [Alphaproteobacteria bacterium]
MSEKPTHPPVQRVGLTMRITKASGYEEPRDSLAQDWAQFMSASLPEVAWMSVPNTGSTAASVVEDWRLDALILTGGDDIGETPLRDETERTLLHHFIDNGMPVFGVCRGMQLIQSEFGGNLRPCSLDEHVASRHEVEFRSASPWPTPNQGAVSVNSFHTMAVHPDDLGEGLIPLAISADGYVEALYASNIPLLAVMWHPEREASLREHDRSLLRRLFGFGEDAEL